MNIFVLVTRSETSFCITRFCNSRILNLWKRKDDLFTKPAPLPGHKKSFYQKPKPLPRSRRLKHSPVNASIKDMDKFEKKEMKKRPFAKTTRHDWLTEYIPKSIKKRWWR